MTNRKADATAWPATGAKIPERHETLLWLFLTASLVFFLRHQYSGIYHDAQIYALLVAAWLSPDAYVRDLFFLFGSQGDFSLFSPVYGWGVELLGLANAAKTVVLVGGVLWISGAIGLSRAALKDSWAASLAALLLVWTTHSYAPNGATFHVIEEFATARSIAVPLALISIALAIKGRPALACLLAAAATAIHPLMGIWALLLIVGVRMADRTLLLAISIVALVLATGWLLPGLPFLHPMPDDWALPVKASTHDVFIGGWGVFRLNDHLFWLFALLIGGTLGRQELRRWYLVAACVTAYAILLAAICSHYYPIRLVVQAQLWRVCWIAFVLGIVALLDACHTAVSNDSGARHWIISLAICTYLLSAFSSLVLLVVILARFPSGRAVFVRVNQVYSAFPCLRWAVPATLVLAAIPGYVVDMEIDGAAIAYPWFNSLPFLKGLVLAGGGGLTLLFLSIASRHVLFRRASAALMLPFLAATLANWDQRLPASVRAEEGYLSSQERPFQRFVMPGDVVAWPGGEIETWFEMGTANYAYWVQGVGSVFSNEKRLEVSRRLRRLERARCMKDEAVVDSEGRCSNPVGRLGMNAMRYLCEDQALTWVVTERMPSVGAPPEDIFLPRNGWSERFLYRCATLRNEPAGAVTGNKWSHAHSGRLNSPAA